MKLYIKGDFSRTVPFGYEELAYKMWTKEVNGKPLEFSHIGDTETLQEDFWLSLSQSSWLNDSRWNNKDILATHSVLEHDTINLHFEDDYVTDSHSKREMLILYSDHLHLLTINKRAMYIMATEVASVIDGKISEDNKKTWISVDDFKAKYRDLLALSYKEATDISLEEIKTVKQVDEPYFEEERQEGEKDFIDDFTAEHHLPPEFHQYFTDTVAGQEYNRLDLEDVSEEILADWLKEHGREN